MIEKTEDSSRSQKIDKLEKMVELERKRRVQEDLKKTIEQSPEKVAKIIAQMLNERKE